MSCTLQKGVKVLRYNIKVKLKKKSPLPVFPTRRALAMMGFTAFTRNTVSNEWAAADSDYSKVTTLDDSITEYWYVFNGNKLPRHCDKNVLTFLEDNPNISSYTIEKREI